MNTPALVMRFLPVLRRRYGILFSSSILRRMDLVTEPVTADPSPKRYYRVSQVASRINQLLAPARGAQFWLRAEITSSRERNGIFYCELVEINRSGQQVARLRSVILRNDLARIRREFLAAGLELDLSNGVSIGALCTVEFDALHGLSLRLLAMDPAFLVGELELKRRAIIGRLAQDDLLRLNADKPLPLLPMRVGVVAGVNSSGLSDLLRTAQQSGYGFTLLVADAVVQGPTAESAVIRALRACIRLEVDLIVIVRGGGSKTDLAWLDNEAIARTIANSPVPVWTGIGHETDTSVLDQVAARAYKTPSALAEGLVQHVAVVDRLNLEAYARLHSVWRFRVKVERDDAARARLGLHQGTRKLLDVTRERLIGNSGRTTERVRSRLQGERAAVVSHRGSLRSAATNVIALSRLLLGRTGGNLVRIGELQLQRRREQLALRASRLRSEQIGRLLHERRAQTRERDRLLITLVRGRLGQERERLRPLRIPQRHAQARVLAERSALERLRARFRPEVAIRRVSEAQSYLQVVEQVVRASSPATALSRGFSLTYDSQGRLVTSLTQVRVGDLLTTEIKEGVIRSGVTEVKNE